MINQYQPITQATVDALATLANGKFPTLPPIVFPPFAGKDKIGLPPKLTSTPNYGGGDFDDGSNIAFWIFAYKTIAGKKTYSYAPVTSVVTGKAGSGMFSITWTWVSVTGATAPDGYIAVKASSDPGFSYQFLWKDIGNVETLTITDKTFPGFVEDDTMKDSGDAVNLPCWNAIWLKLINRIRVYSNYTTDIMCNNAGDVTGLTQEGAGPFLYDGSITTLGIAGLVSGPWCVGVSDAAANTLECWVPRLSMFGPPATPNYNICFTQVYRGMKYYFRHQDASSIDISYKNELLSFQIASDVTTGTTSAHFPLTIVSCSDGHILVKQTATGTIRADMDVTAGNVYDISFDLMGSVLPGEILFAVMDFTFTTPNATGAGTPVAGIELSNNIRFIEVPDSYCEIAFNNPVAILEGSPFTFQPCTTCLQLTLTLNNSISGIWSAFTIPTFGVMPYLDQDLPQYQPSSTFPADTRRVPVNASLPYIPVVNNRGSLWPVFRDTDFKPDSLAGQAFKGSPAWQQSIATKEVDTNQVNASVPTYEPDELLYIALTAGVPAGASDARFLCQGSGLTVYLKKDGFPTLASFDVSGAAGTWISVASFPSFDDGTWFMGIYNPALGNVSAVSSYVVILNGIAPNGTFFPTDGSGNSSPEGYSYFFSDPARTTNYPTPLLGYTVYSITVRRMPVDNGSGVLLAPSTGKSALNVSVGIMEGFGFEAQGTFTNIQTFTIPAGQSEVVATVFWPVLSGTPLATTSKDVQIRAEVNFQPQCHSTFANGFWSGTPWYSDSQALLSFKGGSQTDPIILPVGATVVNDLTAVLNLLP